ncbi:SepM family pheromone-processing serine protease [Streptococcus cuniculipharyngis]|uniref:endopeptidase La n=1 Tax=Streptococcus cuniculipharyngis TaxID=1562651 RepID=A0A5C5SD90_9STRE|nr:SepM family pheromone-processing serine protease [Streptococcus cuniculipharyngis]TWS98252.1 PDZ domain-containing protein [Streptococcus cuniculipharyngis]
MKKNKRFKWWLLSLCSVLVVLFAFLYPLPYYLELPGGAYDIRTALTVDGKEDKKKGSYYFTAVSVGRATLAHVIYAWLTPFSEIQSEKGTTGGYSEEDYVRINQFYMETSQNGAVYQALKLADRPVSLDFLGVYVLDVAEDSTFRGILNLADTVTGVNDKTFKSSKELIDYVGGLTIGDKVSVQYTSDGKQKSAEGKIIKLSNGRNGIGIGLVDHTQISSDVAVKFTLDGVGGPSAGLMFTLAIYDQLIDEDLRKGRVIAGTGTIEQDGSVGDIGGAGLKVVAADKSGADIFFVPNNPVDEAILKENPDAKTNYQEALQAAEKLKTKMKIVPVKNVQEALDYLRQQ